VSFRLSSVMLKYMLNHFYFYFSSLDHVFWTWSHGRTLGCVKCSMELDLPKVWASKIKLEPSSTTKYYPTKIKNSLWELWYHCVSFLILFLSFDIHTTHYITTTPPSNFPFLLPWFDIRLGYHSFSTQIQLGLVFIF
jgi:hypothetical protein